MRVLRWLSSVVLLTVALATLGALGDGGLAPPPLSLDGAGHWASTREPVVAVFALVRVGALAVGVYLLLVLIASGASGSVRRETQHGDPRSVHVRAGARPPRRPGTRRADGADGDRCARATRSGSLEHSLRPRGRRSRRPTPSEAVIRPVVDEPVPTQASPPDTGEQYQVATGESFWSVAARHLSDVTGRVDLSDSEIAVYWRALMDANPLPNPDLLFVGQVIALPAVTL